MYMYTYIPSVFVFVLNVCVDTHVKKIGQVDSTKWTKILNHQENHSVVRWLVW